MSQFDKFLARAISTPDQRDAYLRALASDENLGARPADCGCCTVVDSVSLDNLRSALSGACVAAVTDALNAAAKDVRTIPAGYPTNPQARSLKAISRWLRGRAGGAS